MAKKKTEKKKEEVARMPPPNMKESIEKRLAYNKKLERK